MAASKHSAGLVSLGISDTQWYSGRIPEALANPSDLYERPAQVPSVFQWCFPARNLCERLNCGADSESRTSGKHGQKC